MAIENEPAGKDARAKHLAKKFPLVVKKDPKFRSWVNIPDVDSEVERGYIRPLQDANW